MKIVLDTNVLISAFLWGGKPKDILERVFEGKDTLFISKPILDEVFEVLTRPKFKTSSEIASLYVHTIEDLAELVYPAVKIADVLRDSDDHIILECALQAEAECIITGDNDLLVHENYQNIKIMTVQTYHQLVYKT